MKLGSFSENLELSLKALRRRLARERKKKIYHLDGTHSKVPIEDWINHLNRNPDGLTAYKALEENDPDLPEWIKERHKEK